MPGRAQMIKDMATAARLVEFGHENKASEALITAASLLRKLDAAGGAIEKLTVPVEDEKGKKLDVADEKDRSLKEQADDLFDQADGMGGPGVAALVNAAKARTYPFKTRGALGAPRRISRKISAGSTHVYTITFKGGQPAAIGFHSSHPAHFRIVSPGRGDLQSSIVTTSSYTWRPGGNITVKVHVNGMAHNASYTITTN